MFNKGKFARASFSREYVAMDITSTEVRLISVFHNKLVKAGAEQLKEGVVKNGIVQEPQTLGLVIENLFKSLQLSRDLGPLHGYRTTVYLPRDSLCRITGKRLISILSNGLHAKKCP